MPSGGPPMWSELLPSRSQHMLRTSAYRLPHSSQAHRGCSQQAHRAVGAAVVVLCYDNHADGVCLPLTFMSVMCAVMVSRSKQGRVRVNLRISMPCGIHAYTSQQRQRSEVRNPFPCFCLYGGTPGTWLPTPLKLLQLLSCSTEFTAACMTS